MTDAIRASRRVLRSDALLVRRRDGGGGDDGSFTLGSTEAFVILENLNLLSNIRPNSAYGRLKTAIEGTTEARNVRAARADFATYMLTLNTRARNHLTSDTNEKELIEQTRFQLERAKWVGANSSNDLHSHGFFLF